jgi:hypothetical protein
MGMMSASLLRSVFQAWWRLVAAGVGQPKKFDELWPDDEIANKGL